MATVSCKSLPMAERLATRLTDRFSFLRVSIDPAREGNYNVSYCPDDYTKQERRQIDAYLAGYAVGLAISADLLEQQHR